MLVSVGGCCWFLFFEFFCSFYVVREFSVFLWVFHVSCLMLVMACFAHIAAICWILYALAIVFTFIFVHLVFSYVFLCFGVFVRFLCLMPCACHGMFCTHSSYVLDFVCIGYVFCIIFVHFMLFVSFRCFCEFSMSHALCLPWHVLHTSLPSAGFCMRWL